MTRTNGMTYPMTISDAQRALAAGEVSSAELTEQALRAADRDDAVLGVFVSRFAEQAMTAAKKADAARASGADLPLLGIPVAVKDIISTVDGETTAQSLVLDRRWGTDDAAVVARLRAAGAVVVGKTTTMEFALGSPDPSKPFPIPRNPWDVRRWAGGSSSGSGSGIASGMFLGALGTDTGASVRMPSALCGITGLKPTFGRVPKSGVVPLGYSLDCVGPMARTARDCAQLLSVMAGADVDDPSAVVRPVADYPSALSGDLTGLRIGVDDLSRFSGPHRDPALDGMVSAAAAVLRDRGATIVPVEVPYYPQVTAAATISILAEALAYHSPDLRTRWPDYFAATRLGLAMAAFTNGSDYVQAHRVRRVGQRAVAALFDDVDVVLTPTVARPAPPIAEAGDYTGTLFAGQDFAYHTAYWNALGNPALTVPIGFTADGLPLGMQLAGRPFDEATLLRVGDAYQLSTSWHAAAHPPIPGAIPEDLDATATGELPTPTATAAEAMLRTAGLDVPAEELPVLAASLALVRHNADLLHGVDAARYEDPGSVFRADLASTTS
jgi:aspartyl-tRNA(Asn)/glutamyl-tRNA(Gln) amidotransferase subunit A